MWDMCSASFFQLYLAEQFDVVERLLYEDSCSIEVWSDGSGWEQVFFAGGWDLDRIFRLYTLGVDPEYNTYNGDISAGLETGWVNFTEDGTESEDLEKIMFNARPVPSFLALKTGALELACMRTEP
jgi:hypothetical protein